MIKPEEVTSENLEAFIAETESLDDQTRVTAMAQAIKNHQWIRLTAPFIKWAVANQKAVQSWADDVNVKRKKEDR